MQKEKKLVKVELLIVQIFLYAVALVFFLPALN